VFDSAGIHPVLIGTIFALNAEVSNAAFELTGGLMTGSRPETGSGCAKPGPSGDPDERDEILCW
jgi:hypothetical protein